MQSLIIYLIIVTIGIIIVPRWIRLFWSIVDLLEEQYRDYRGY